METEILSLKSSSKVNFDDLKKLKSLSIDF